MTMGDMEKKSGSSSGWLWRLALVGALVGLLGLAWWFGVGDILSFQWLADNREALAGFVSDQFFASIGVFLLTYILAVALSLPGAVFLTLGGGFLFGGALGGALSVLGATAGASCLFIIAKTALGNALASRAGPRLAGMREGFAKNAFYYLLFLRLVPAFPFWLVNLAPAFLGVRWPTFAAATALGIIPGTFAFSFVGGGLGDIIDKQRDLFQACLAQGGASCRFELNPAALLGWELLAGFALLGFAALIPVLLQRYRDTPVEPNHKQES